MKLSHEPVECLDGTKGNLGVLKLEIVLMKALDPRYPISTDARLECGETGTELKIDAEMRTREIKELGGGKICTWLQLYAGVA